jgi:hypothetical protein
MTQEHAAIGRREMIRVLGALGCGVAASPNTSQAEEHGAHEKKDSELTGPVKGLHAHFCGIHVAKGNPRFQVVAQHYCSARSEEMHQCLLYDSCEKNARLLGVEYIIVDAAYRRLPETEKKYWHPHTYEVLAGGLIAPGMEATEESKFMKSLLNTWGKTWHTWPDPQTAVPLGEPLLIWSFTGDGQANEELVAARDRQFGISTAKIRERRVREIGLQVPQVSQPNSIERIGRQWTDEGRDAPTPVRAH